MVSTKKSYQWAHYAWDFWCIISILGWWPRFIEPSLLKQRHLDLFYTSLPSSLHGLKILHISDLHLLDFQSASFYKKLKKALHNTHCDLMLITGDLLTYSKMRNQEKLYDLLSNARPTLGKFACLGNHDYSQYVTQGGSTGSFIETNPPPLLIKCWRRLKGTKEGIPLEEKHLPLSPHKDVEALYQASGVRLLRNETVQVCYQGENLNICGLGDVLARDVDLKKAFLNYQQERFGIVLSHNPSLEKSLKNYPGELLLSGHLHGGQVRFPGFSYLFHKEYSASYFKTVYELSHNKYLHVSKGSGTHIPFRWGVFPEITWLTLQPKGISCR